MLAWLLNLLRRLIGENRTGAQNTIDDIGEKDVPPTFAYALRDDFISPAELSFFRVLRHAVGDELYILSKVNLADLVYAPSQPAQFVAWQKINRKHVDFVVCSAESLRPRLVIELDDRSHQRADRAARDRFVDGIFAEVGLPVLRVPARFAYSATELTHAIQQKLQMSITEVQKASQSDSAMDNPELAPRCPQCGGEMRLRTATRGAHRGEAFWGCVNYPRCRTTLSANAAQH